VEATCFPIFVMQLAQRGSRAIPRMHARHRPGKPN
jgi:hypothetical protein